ncbi:hypothetical protein MRX96_026900 [Rhipicephalus microplus]
MMFRERATANVEQATVKLRLLLLHAPRVLLPLTAGSGSPSITAVGQASSDERATRRIRRYSRERGAASTSQGRRVCSYRLELLPGWRSPLPIHRRKD